MSKRGVIAKRLPSYYGGDKRNAYGGASSGGRYALLFQRSAYFAGNDYRNMAIGMPHRRCPEILEHRLD